MVVVVVEVVVVVAVVEKVAAVAVVGVVDVVGVVVVVEVVVDVIALAGVSVVCPSDSGLIVVNISTSISVEDSSTIIASVDASIASTKSKVTSSVDTSICFDDSSSNKRKDSDSIELSNKSFGDFFGTFGIANPDTTFKIMLEKIINPAKTIVNRCELERVTENTDDLINLEKRHHL